jgi:hypothetical protein
MVAGAIGAAAALSVGVFAATRDDGPGAVPSTTTTTPTTTTPRRSSTSVASPNQPSRGTPPSTAQTPDNGGTQLPDAGGELPDLGQLPDLNGQSIDEIIREILRRLGIDPDTLVPASGQQGATPDRSGGAGR